MALSKLKVLFINSAQNNTFISMALYVDVYSHFGENQISSTCSSSPRNPHNVETNIVQGFEPCIAACCLCHQVGEKVRRTKDKVQKAISRYHVSPEDKTQLDHQL